MYIIREPALNWNKFGWYDVPKSKDNEVHKWQIDSMPGWTSTPNKQSETAIIDIDRKYKNSIFNIRKRFENNDVIFNTASECVVIFEEKERYEFDNFVNNKEKISVEFLQTLFDFGILVFAEDDEFSKFHFIRKRATHTQEKIKSFVIYPTHECNARCFYCFAQEDTKTNKKMTVEIANNALQYIYKQVKPDDEVVFRWFGGEPLMATDIMDYIIDNFNEHFENSIKYHSIITTNISLMTDDLVLKAKNKWNLRKVLIPLDGFQAEHDKRKNYYQQNQNQYELVLENIEKLLANGIYVVCRLNLDHKNVTNIKQLFDDLEKFKSYDHFFLHVTTLHIPAHTKKLGDYIHFNQFNDFYSMVFEELFKRGFHKHISEIIPKRMMSVCTAMLNNYSLINADGYLFRCEQEEHSIQNNVGDCKTGIVHNENLQKWLNTDIEKECESCIFLPICQGGCKHYRFRNDENLSPCTRAKYYSDTLMNFIFKWYQENVVLSENKK